MKFLILMVVIFTAYSCVESKKEDSGVSRSSSGKKYFVTTKEIQALNTIFTDQFKDVGSKLIQGVATSVSTQSLVSANYWGIERQTITWCSQFKENYIDDAILNGGFTCSSANECSGEDHFMNDCSSSNVAYSCGGNTNNIESLNSDIHIDYSKFDTEDRIYVKGNFTGNISGDDFESLTPIDCDFNFTYVYGAPITFPPSCDYLDITCDIGGNIAICEHVLDIGSGGASLESCNLE